MKRELLIFTAKIFIVILLVLAGLFVAMEMGMIRDYGKKKRFSIVPDLNAMRRGDAMESRPGTIEEFERQDTLSPIPE